MQQPNKHYDYIIIGGGIIGLTVAQELLTQHSSRSILILEKESHVGCHASGLNSGVLHAGFYYDADSLKAKLCLEGNRLMKNFCRSHGLALNECGKVVVCRNERELETLHELKRRGDVNGVELEMIDEGQLEEVEPLAKTYRKALFSQSTASVDPRAIMSALYQQLIEQGVEFRFNTKVLRIDKENIIQTTQYTYAAGYLINTAGLYADKLAHQVGIGLDYVLLPFKGRYIKSMCVSSFKRHIYPVPDMAQPFLGVHYTITVDGKAKIGPTAIPALWREQYGLSGFSYNEFAEVVPYLAHLFFKNQFGFRRHALNEIKRYSNWVLKREALTLVKADKSQYGRSPDGIRAQLLNRRKGALVKDFIYETTPNSLHVLNAVSPAFTSSWAFAKMLVNAITFPNEVSYAA